MQDKSLVLARKRLRKPPNPAFPFVKCKTYRFLWTKIFSLLVRIALQMWQDDAKHKCSKTSFNQKAISKTALSVALPFAFIRRLCPSPLLNIGIFCSLRCFHCFSKLPRDQRHRCDTPNIVRNIISVFYWVLWIQIQMCIFSSLWAATNSTHFHKTSVSAFC